MSAETIYCWIYALPKRDLAAHGFMLRTGRTQRRPRGRRKTLAGARIVAMTSIDAGPAEVAGRQVPGHWEGDLVIGKAGKTALASLVERASRYTEIVALPGGATRRRPAMPSSAPSTACPPSWSGR